MKTTHSKFLALFLVALLVLFNVPFTSFAVGNPTYKAGNDKDIPLLDDWNGNRMKIDSGKLSIDTYSDLESDENADFWEVNGDLVVDITKLIPKIEEVKNDETQDTESDEDEDGEIIGFSWTSNIPVFMVFVKGGNGGNLYEYPDGSKGDTALYAPSPHGISHITFYYDPKPTTGQLTLTKVVTGDVLTENATFEFTVQELSEDNEPVEGTEMTVSVTVESGETQNSETIDLPFGKYLITESNLPDNFTFVSIDNDAVTIEAGSDEETIVTNDYTAPKGTITVNKVRELAEGVNAETDLPDGEFDFEILDSDSKVVDEFTLSSDNEYTFTSDPLPVGRYTIKEVDMPAGYKAVVTTTGVTLSDVEGLDLDEKTVDFVNEYDPTLGNLIVKKLVTAADGTKPVDGIFEFKLEKSNGEGYDLVQVEGEDTFTIETSGAKGQQLISGLAEGDYRITEINYGRNYEPKALTINVNVIANEDVTAETFENFYTPDPEITLEIRKRIVDVNGNTITNRSTVPFGVSLNPDMEYPQSRSMMTIWDQDFTITTASPKVLSESYFEWPDLYPNYLIEEISLPTTNYDFLRFEVQYEYGDESSDVTTFTDKVLELALFEETVPSKVIVTIVNRYTPSQDDEEDDEDDEDDDDEDEDEDDEIVEDDEEEVEVFTDSTPFSSPQIQTTTVPVEEVALATLPKTGEIPSTVFYGLGALVSGLGVFFRRKQS